MGLAVTLVLLALWRTLSSRAFQRGDLLLAVILLALAVAPASTASAGSTARITESSTHDPTLPWARTARPPSPSGASCRHFRYLW
jgi:hypothetical protein